MEACPTLPALRCYFWENVNVAVIVQPRRVCVCVCVRSKQLACEDEHL